MSYGYVDGTAMFTRIREGEEDLGYKEAGAKFGGWYVMNVIVDEETVEQMDKSNIVQAEFAKPVDEGFLVKFKRKKPEGTPKTFLLDGDVESGFHYPKDANDLKNDVDGAEEGVNVWSGDKVRVFFRVTDTGKTNRKGSVMSAKLVGIRVLEKADRTVVEEEMPF